MSNRYWSTAINDQHGAPHFLYIYDPAAIITNGPQTLTGAWRPYTTADITAVSITGLTVAVDNTAVTGGFINLNSGTFTPTFTGISGGQFQIPAGARAWSVIIASGGAYINGTLFNSVSAIGGGGYPNFTLGSAINVGITGGYANISYEV
jgi:hypothetical protein